MFCVLDAAGISCCELFQSGDGGDVWHCKVARSHDDGIKDLVPPIVEPVASMLFRSTQSQLPFLAAGVLDSPLNSRIILDKPVIALVDKKILDVLSNHRMMPKRGIQSMPLNRPLRSHSWDRLLRERHGTRVHIRLQPRIHRGIREAVVRDHRCLARKSFRDIQRRVSRARSQSIEVELPRRLLISRYPALVRTIPSEGQGKGVIPASARLFLPLKDADHIKHLLLHQCINRNGARGPGADDSHALDRIGTAHSYRILVEKRLDLNRKKGKNSSAASFQCFPLPLGRTTIQWLFVRFVLDSITPSRLSLREYRSRTANRRTISCG